ncbi:MAG TPA: HAMP domain-containing sensor histidine kinase [Rhizomicrobium sp.]|nr:HAMP domain-containing sensor histidine kinase [Rhizomicrobium sp.]
MAGRAHAQLADALRLVAHSLSGRLLLLTLLYVMMSAALISAPSIARYHKALLDMHIESAELAILPFTEPGGSQLSAGLRAQLLARAGAGAVMLKRPEQRELFLVHGMPGAIDRTIDLRHADLMTETEEALDCIFAGDDRTLHVIAPTHIKGAQTIEVIVGEKSIRAALIHYSLQTLRLGLFISIAAAVLVFLSLYFVLVRPMRRITAAMVSFRENPEDASRIVAPSRRSDEIGIAERELAGMQREIYGFLQQKARLAALGSAVAKIQHDLRNILSSAQMASDRLTAVDDPVVKHLTPRLVASLDRAVALATATLRYGRADERPPDRKLLPLHPLIAEAGEFCASKENVCFINDVDPLLKIDADPEHLYRVLLNLVRNATEALAFGGTITIKALRAKNCVNIEICDTGSGIAESLRDRLFQPFATAARPGGSGLGLAIARDLARAHGGDVILVETSANGTRFRIDIPDREQ